MPKSPSAFYQPATLPEALQLLAKPDVLPLAGGTKLLAGDVQGAVVDLQKLGLTAVTRNTHTLTIGATLPLAELTKALPDDDTSPTALLRQAITLAGPNTYRNAATLGGTIASRLPDSELLAALLVLDAVLTLHTPDLAQMSLAEYLAAEERPSGLITAVTLAWETGQGRSERVARTPRDYPIVSVTFWQLQNGAVRLAGTGMQERPCRLTTAEAKLVDGLTPEAIAQAGQAAQSAATHPGDFRGDAAYRAEMTAVLIQRVCK